MKMLRIMVDNIFIYILCLVSSLFTITSSKAQMHQPVKWYFMATPQPNQEAVLTITASLEDGWHIYSQFIEEGGPLPTTFKFQPTNDYVLVDKVKEESKPIQTYDRTFDM